MPFVRKYDTTYNLSERKKFDEMWDIPRLYTSACSYAVQPVRLYPILMSILLHHFKELTECISEVERIESMVKRKNKGLTKEKEEEEEQLTQQPRPTALPPLRPQQLKLSEF